MSSTLTTTCPLCGLRFPGRPLLDLHIRDDHRERDHRPAEPAHGDSAHGGPAGTGAPGDGAGGPSGGDSLAPGPAGPAQEKATATKPEPRPGRALTALRRAIGSLRSPARAGRAA